MAWIKDGRAASSPNRVLLSRLEPVIERAIESTAPVRNRRARLAALGRAASAILAAEYELKSLDDFFAFAGNERLAEELYNLRHALEELPPAEKKVVARRIQAALPCVGKVKAKHLVDSGARSVQSARTAVKERARSARYKMMLSEYPLMSRIDLQEADEILSLFQEGHDPKDYEFHLAGRHRRQSNGARAVVIVVAHNDEPQQLFMTNETAAARGQVTQRTTQADMRGAVVEEEILRPLRLRGCIAAAARAGAHASSCLFRLPKPDETRTTRLDAIERKEGAYALVDLFWAPRAALGAALFSCTGDRAFVRLMRSSAVKRGLALQSWGMYRRCADDEDIDEALLPQCVSARPDKRKPPPAEGERAYWRFVPTSTERAVFEELGEEYIAPERRSFSNVLPGLSSKRKASAKGKGARKTDERDEDIDLLYR